MSLEEGGKEGIQSGGRGWSQTPHGREEGEADPPGRKTPRCKASLFCGLQKKCSNLHFCSFNQLTKTDETHRFSSATASRRRNFSLVPGCPQTPLGPEGGRVWRPLGGGARTPFPSSWTK